MKKFARMFVLSLLMVLGGQTIAQNSGAIFLGASFPMGYYGKGDYSQWALINEGDQFHSAGASIGANVGLKWNFGVGVKGLSVMLSVDGFYNGLNNELKEYFEQRNIDLKNDPLISSFSIDRPRFFNVPAMVGINYVLRLSPAFGIYVEGGVGANARFITSYYEAIRYVAVDATAVMNYAYKTAFSFAYQAGLGFEIANNFMIGASFYDLGASKIVAERTRPVHGTDMFRNESGIVPRMVVARIGFKF